MPAVAILTENKKWRQLIAEALEYLGGYTVVDDPVQAALWLTDGHQEPKDKPFLALVPPVTPLRLAELHRRMEAALANSKIESMSLGKGIRLLPADKRLEYKNKYIELTEKEAELLQLLIEAGEAGMAREALLEQVWDYSPDVNTHTLETHIHRLRAKLKALPELAECLRTTGPGYAWVDNG